MYLEVITTKERIGFGGSSYGGGLGNRTVPTKDIALAIGRGYFFVPVREPRDRPSDALGALRVGIKKPTPCGVGFLCVFGGEPRYHTTGRDLVTATMLSWTRIGRYPCYVPRRYVPLLGKRSTNSIAHKKELVKS